MAQGSTGNVIAALASLLLPGCGQLLQGRLLAAIGYFLLFIFLWMIFLGWLVHLAACLDAATWKGPSR